MKTLILIRHAKSSWDSDALSDRERPLNKRGIRDAPFMGGTLKSKSIRPQLLISSPALRAHTTAKYIAGQIDYPEDNIRIEDLIYESGSRSIINLLASLNDKLNQVAIFGHNPDFSYLATYFSGSSIGNVPTCGIVCIDFPIETWKDIPDTNGKLRFFDFPKNYSKEEIRAYK